MNFSYLTLKFSVEDDKLRGSWLHGFSLSSYPFVCTNPDLS